MATHSTLTTNPGNGPGIDTVTLASGVQIPTTVLRAMQRDSTQDPVDLIANQDGALRVDDGGLAMAIAEAAREMPPFSRDNADRIRVYVDTGNIGIASVQWGNFNQEPGYYGTGSGNAMDIREMHREATMANFHQHMTTWTFS